MEPQFGEEERGKDQPAAPSPYGDQAGLTVPPPAPPTYWTDGQPAPNYPYGYTEPPFARPRRRGLVGWLTWIGLAVLGLAKYGVVLLKFKFALTLLSMLVSFGGYALVFGPWAAAVIVVMIFVHEMGHVIEIRRQGMQATAPVFIPFLGAAIFQRSHPTDALKQAEIGIAGPILGSVGATAAFALYGATGLNIFLFAAYFGFLINLINLIPAGMLDGAWVLAPASKWFLAAGLAVIGVMVVAPELFGFTSFSPIFLLVVLFGIPTTIARFRNDKLPYYQSVPPAARWAMGLAWVGLVVFLGFAQHLTFGLLQSNLR